MSRDDREHKPLFNIDPLRAVIDAGTPVITSNLRLSRNIHKAWGYDCMNRGLDTWQTPAILPLETWLQECWLKLVDAAYSPALAGTVIAPAQESLLWEQVIASDPSLAPELNPENFAELARRGWKLLRQWQVPQRELAGIHHSGTRHLLHWAEAVNKQLAGLGMIDGESRGEIVARGFREGILPSYERIVVAGFQTLPPLMESVLSAATRHLEHFSPARQRGASQRFAAETLDDEIAAAARWAQRTAEAHPEATIGIVVPQLTALQKMVEREFRNQFQPHWCLPQTGYTPAPFNISSGSPLGEAPVISSALALLRLLAEPVTTQGLCALLNSPFWGDADREGDVRCRAQKELLDLGLYQFSAGRFRQLLQSVESRCDDGPEQPLSQRLGKFATWQRTLKRTQSFQQWREVFSAGLDILAWPGRRTPDSLEFQQMDHWQELLSTFAATDRVAGPVDIQGALKRLDQLARDTVFHPQTPDSRIQILGLLEAAGLEFDYLWVMNMDNRHWPEPTSPHPLLPVGLQRQRAMPRSCPAQELQLSQELFELFAASAREIIFSHAQRDGDVHLQPASMAAGLPPVEFSEKPPGHPWLESLAASIALERVDDSRGPVFQPPEGRVRGGTRLLADQARCPFNAFAQWRLAAEPLGEPQTGLGAQLRGILVHNSLEFLWREVGTQSSLLTLDDNALKQRVEKAVAQAMSDVFSSNSYLTRADFGDRLLLLETQRLQSLLSKWLQVEKERPAFAVESTEKMVAVELDGLKISLRLDRLDRVASVASQENNQGSLVIIDYKTGKTSLSAIAAERLTEPQLALYALALDETPAAVTYATIHRKKTGFDGIATTENILPGCKSLAALGLPEDWPGTIALWRQKLNSLVTELRNGRADVTFYSRDALNYSIWLEPLNRIAGREDLAAITLAPGQPGETP